MYCIHYTVAPKSNVIKLLITIIALSANVTAINLFNADSEVTEPRKASRNSSRNFLKHKAIEIERRNYCSAFSMADCCNLLENQARKLDRSRRSGRSACGGCSFFSDFFNVMR